MPLHPDMVKVIEAMADFGYRPMETLTPAEARAQSEAMAALRADPSEDEGLTIEDRTIPVSGIDLPARTYRPEGTEGEALPALAYYHGGGHVIGSLDTHHDVARHMAREAYIAVVSVGYRKAPEHKFPIAAEDCFEALAWVAANGDALGVDGTRLAIGGDSAGANLAAVTALLARQAGGPAPRLQILVYPITDYACDAPSYETFAEGYGGLTRDAMLWFQDHYLDGPEDIADWRASPNRAPDHAGLAPALVVTAECDVLLDDSLRYIETLKAAGVAVEHANYDGMIHGFFSMATSIAATADARARAVAALRRALG